MQNIDSESWQKSFDEFAELDLSAIHNPKDQRIESLNESDVNDILIKMGKKTKKDQLDCGACGYESCVEHAIAIKRDLLKLRCACLIQSKNFTNR